MPAKAGIHSHWPRRLAKSVVMGPRLREDDTEGR
jgi:hypothetical protein